MYVGLENETLHSKYTEIEFQILIIRIGKKNKVFLGLRTRGCTGRGPWWLFAPAAGRPCVTPWRPQNDGVASHPGSCRRRSCWRGWSARRSRCGPSRSRRPPSDCSLEEREALLSPRRANLSTASKELTTDNSKHIQNECNITTSIQQNMQCKQIATKGVKVKIKIKLLLSWFKRPKAAGTQEFLCPFVLHLSR